jgi:rod shape-determining protein MreD
MNSRTLQIAIQFIVLIVLQLLLFNNIQFSGFINPYVYVLFFILLPFDFPKWLMLLLGLMMGLLIDLFSGTPGVHATATVLIAYLRPFLLAIVAPHDGYDNSTMPRISYMGIDWFIKFTIIFVLIHHLVLFYVEVFSFAHFFRTFLKVILSSLFTIVIIILSQFFVFRK